MAIEKLHYKLCRRFINTAIIKEMKKPNWLKPVGYETNITIYNPVAKRNVPLILKNKNCLTWYMCGPTVYDSAHIGHATTYVKSDIIRRILSDYFNINVAIAMCITDIDDKIVAKSIETKQHYQDLTEYYKNEFIEDMELLNVSKSHLYCKVTDFIPQIIQFVHGIVNKGNAYVTKDGSVYFDINKYNMYGKFQFAPPSADSDHPYKKSALDFSLWKAAKENEPSWESPWGHGRPGWHIECSAIASTVFGNTLDIHSGGIDLAFPHHENEEAQSCCYHEVDQWVNYWLHCGHLCLADVKMSKSLKNTITIREFLDKYTANQFRVLCLLSHYKTGIQFSDDVINTAIHMLNKIEHFINDCENYITGNWNVGNVDEITLFRVLEQTRNNVDVALTNDFNTARAMQSLEKLIDTGNKMLHDSHGHGKSRSIPAIVAVSNYISRIFSKFGISYSTQADDFKVNNLVEHFVNFRNIVRTRAKEQNVKDESLFKACDEARSNLSSCGIVIKDSKDRTTWSIKKY